MTSIFACRSSNFHAEEGEEVEDRYNNKNCPHTSGKRCRFLLFNYQLSYLVLHGVFILFVVHDHQPFSSKPKSTDCTNRANQYEYNQMNRNNYFHQDQGQGRGNQNYYARPLIGNPGCYSRYGSAGYHQVYDRNRKQPPPPPPPPPPIFNPVVAHHSVGHAGTGFNKSECNRPAKQMIVVSTTDNGAGKVGGMPPSNNLSLPTPPPPPPPPQYVPLQRATDSNIAGEPSSNSSSVMLPKFDAKSGGESDMVDNKYVKVKHDGSTPNIYNVAHLVPAVSAASVVPMTTPISSTAPIVSVPIHSEPLTIGVNRSTLSESKVFTPVNSVITPGTAPTSVVRKKSAWGQGVVLSNKAETPLRTFQSNDLTSTVESSSDVANGESSSTGEIKIGPALLSKPAAGPDTDIDSDTQTLKKAPAWKENCSKQNSRASEDIRVECAKVKSIEEYDDNEEFTCGALESITERTLDVCEEKTDKTVKESTSSSPREHVVRPSLTGLGNSPGRSKAGRPVGSGRGKNRGRGRGRQSNDENIIESEYSNALSNPVDDAPSAEEGGGLVEVAGSASKKPRLDDSGTDEHIVSGARAALQALESPIDSTTCEEMETEWVAADLEKPMLVTDGALSLKKRRGRPPLGGNKSSKRICAEDLAFAGENLDDTGSVGEKEGSTVCGEPFTGSPIAKGSGVSVEVAKSSDSKVGMNGGRGRGGRWSSQHHSGAGRPGRGGRARSVLPSGAGRGAKKNSICEKAVDGKGFASSAGKERLRLTLGEVFSQDTEIIRAYHAVRYMAEMQQPSFLASGKSGIHAAPAALALLLQCNCSILSKEDQEKILNSSLPGSTGLSTGTRIASKLTSQVNYSLSLLPQQLAYKKIPIPFTNEIASCLDLVEAKSELLWREMMELRRLQKGIEKNLCFGDINANSSTCGSNSKSIAAASPCICGSKASEFALGDHMEAHPSTSIPCAPLLARLRSRSSSIIAADEQKLLKTSSTNDSLSEKLYNLKGIRCKIMANSESTRLKILEENKLRVDEAHLHSNVLAASVQSTFLVNTVSSSTSFSSLPPGAGSNRLNSVGEVAVCGDGYFRRKHQKHQMLLAAAAQAGGYNRSNRHGVNDESGALLRNVHNLSNSSNVVPVASNHLNKLSSVSASDAVSASRGSGMNVNGVVEPEGLTSYCDTKARIDNLRPRMIKEIVKRWKGRRDAWNDLANRYLNTSNKWNNYISQVVEAKKSTVVPISSLSKTNSSTSISDTSSLFVGRLRGSSGSGALSGVPGVKNNMSNYMSLSYTGARGSVSIGNNSYSASNALDNIYASQCGVSCGTDLPEDPLGLNNIAESMSYATAAIRAASSPTEGSNQESTSLLSAGAKPELLRSSSVESSLKTWNNNTSSTTLQTLLEESMQRKIDKGVAEIPDMVSPWMYAPDTAGSALRSSKGKGPLSNSANRLFTGPPCPVFPNELCEFNEPKMYRVEGSNSKPEGVASCDSKGDLSVSTPDEVELATYSEFLQMKPFPRQQNIVSGDNFYDISGCRQTTDGRRQLCAINNDLVMNSFSSVNTLRAPCPPGCNCAKQLDKQSRYVNMWSDVEKCIFVDKFLQYPKNFHKISSFLTNKSTKDCIKFYYDSKYLLNFKSMLREHDNRRKNLKNAWSATSSAGLYAGGTIYPPKNGDIKESIMELPHDETYHTYTLHPPRNNHSLGVKNRYDVKRKLNYLQPNYATLLTAERRNYESNMSNEVPLSPKAQYSRRELLSLLNYSMPTYIPKPSCMKGAVAHSVTENCYPSIPSVRIPEETSNTFADSAGIFAFGRGGGRWGITMSSRGRGRGRGRGESRGGSGEGRGGRVNSRVSRAKKLRTDNTETASASSQAGGNSSFDSEEIMVTKNNEEVDNRAEPLHEEVKMVRHGNNLALGREDVLLEDIKLQGCSTDMKSVVVLESIDVEEEGILVKEETAGDTCIPCIRTVEVAEGYVDEVEDQVVHNTEESLEAEDDCSSEMYESEHENTAAYDGHSDGIDIESSYGVAGESESELEEVGNETMMTIAQANDASDAEVYASSDDASTSGSASAAESEIVL